MNKHLLFEEPHEIQGAKARVRVSIKNAIKHQKKTHPSVKYKSDDFALSDFMVTHYAWYEEEEK